MTPTTNFIEFSGTLASGARTAMPASATTITAAPAATERERQVVVVGAERQRDEHDLEALENDTLERQREGIPVGDGATTFARYGLRGRELVGVDLLLVVQCLVAARSQDRLAQPLQAEHEQQPTDNEP